VKKILVLVVLCLVVSGILISEETKKKEFTESEKESYLLGYDIVQNIKMAKPDIDIEAFTLAIQDAIAERDSRLSAEESEQVKQVLSRKMQERQKIYAEMAKEKNLTAGKKFLDDNKTQEGVITTASGLQYKVLKEGAGAAPKATDTVKVHYRGTLLSGKEFDSSFKRNEPATFAANRVIAGWTEGLQLMKVGAKFKFFIPSDLAYGERGNRGIEPNSTLIFEVELLGIQ